MIHDPEDSPLFIPLTSAVYQLVTLYDHQVSFWAALTRDEGQILEFEYETRFGPIIHAHLAKALRQIGFRVGAPNSYFDIGTVGYLFSFPRLWRMAQPLPPPPKRPLASHFPRLLQKTQAAIIDADHFRPFLRFAKP